VNNHGQALLCMIVDKPGHGCIHSTLHSNQYLDHLQKISSVYSSVVSLFIGTGGKLMVTQWFISYVESRKPAHLYLELCVILK